MFRKPTSHTQRREVERKIREPFSKRNNNLSKGTLSLEDCPPEQVHPHNAQPSKTLKVITHKKVTSDPVKAARSLRSKATERDLRASKELEKFQQKTKERTLDNPDASPEEIEKLKNKFRAASYTTTHGYDYGALFDKIDADGGGSLDVEEFGAIVKKFCPDISDRQIKHLLRDADKDGNGSLDREEFVEFLNETAPTKEVEEEEESKWQKDIRACRENWDFFAMIMRLNKKCHEEKYLIPRRKLQQDRMQWRAEEEARIKAEAEAEVEAEKLATEEAVDVEAEAARKAHYSSSDSEHSDDNDNVHEGEEDEDEVLITSSVASMSI